MNRGLIGKKIGMSGTFMPDGRYVPVTVVQAGPCVVTQIKTKSVDGYQAVQLGFGTKKKKRMVKPIEGHLKKSGGGSFAVLREFRIDDANTYELGQVIGPDIFQIGEKVDVTGSTKGRGFTGVVKRHGFHGGKDTHGCTSHRVPGSIGASAWPSRVIKGKKMPGRYGNERKTIRNLEILDIRPEENLILLKGAVPGARSGLIYVRKCIFPK